MKQKLKAAGRQKIQGPVKNRKKASPKAMIPAQPNSQPNRADMALGQLLKKK